MDTVEWNRIQWGRHYSDPCISTIIDLLCSCLAHEFSSPAPCTKCNILLMGLSLKSPGFIKFWHRCLHLIIARASQSQRACEAISIACLQLPHPALSTSPTLNSWLFRWQCPVNSTINILGWFQLRLNNSLALFSRESFEQAHRLPLSMNWLPVLLVFPTLPAPSQTPGHLCRYAKGRLRSYKWIWGALPG